MFVHCHLDAIDSQKIGVFYSLSEVAPAHGETVGGFYSYPPPPH